MNQPLCFLRVLVDVSKISQTSLTAVQFIRGVEGARLALLYLSTQVYLPVDTHKISRIDLRFLPSRNGTK
jgi:hypothetical protein